MDKVYGVNLSPAVRKVLIVLEAKGIEFERINVIPGQCPDGYEKIHPLKLIPGYEDEQIKLGDSSVICSYIDAKYPEGKSLYPVGNAQRHRALWLERYSDTKLFSLLAGGYFAEKLLAPLLMNRPCNDEKVAQTLEALPEQYRYLEGELAGDFLCGNTMSIADVAVGSLFLNAIYAGLEIDNTHWPKLAAYLDRLLHTPEFLRRKEDDKELLAMFG